MQEQIKNWLIQLGVYNCIVNIDGQFFRINMTTGVQVASSEEVTLFPQMTAPDWLKAYIDR